MRRLGHVLIGLGAVVGAGVGIAILGHVGIVGVPWLVNVGLAKLGLVASGALMASGAVSVRVGARREQAVRLADSASIPRD